jgi:D-glycero-D-manno-heptose 1,7-bisphosphate phosphatase
MKILFVDIDGTLTETISGHTFKQSPTDVKIIEDADKAIAHFAKLGWHIVGVSNQGGIASGHKSLDATFQEFTFTLELFPDLQDIYFCPDFDGKQLFVTSKYDVPLEIGFLEEQLEGTYRKPNPGMIQYVLTGIEDEGKTVDEAWMVGDRPEDGQCAINAGINFCPADVWRNKFRTGVFTHAVTPAQLQFLEGVKTNF